MTKINHEAETELKIAVGQEARLDKHLADLYPSYSRTFFKRLINHREIVVDRHAVSPHHQLKPGQTIKITWPKKQTYDFNQPKVQMPFPILYEDDSFLIINKPPNLLCHPTGVKRDGTTLVELMTSKVAKAEWPDDMRPGLVHRLDKDTSGVLIFARTPEAHAKISKQFAARQVNKTYLALVKGVVKPKEGTLECNISRDPRRRKRFRVASVGRLAITKFNVLKSYGEKATLVELKPLTGRTHQLRVQLSHYGHPILGDGIYGRDEIAHDFIHRQMLHAFRIQFTHPDTSKKVEFEAPIPDDMKEALARIQ